MTKETEHALINLNKQFYDKISIHWNSDPDYFWKGWDRLKIYIQNQIDKNSKISVLDLGCGNGRFLSFLAKYFPENSFEYTGIDNADFSKIDTSVYPNIEVKFIELDLMKKDWGLTGQYDIVVAFGLVHHIPGQRLMDQFLDSFYTALSSSGVGIITSWQYMRLERLKRRLILGEDRIKLLQSMAIQESELRDGDNFLDWVKGEYGIRFSHYFSETEMVGLLDKKKLHILDVYLDDDRDKNRNQYFVIKAS